MLVDKSWGLSSPLSLLEVGNDSSLETELDKVEGEVPDDAEAMSASHSQWTNRRDLLPDPDNTDPATRDGVDLGEAPVSEPGNDGRDQLSDTEGDHEGDGWSFSP